jgi:two-component system NarL family sensor kinase
VSARADAAEDRAVPLGLAFLRLGLLPIVFLTEYLVEHPSSYTSAFEPLLAATAVYALVILALRLSARRGGRLREPAWMVETEPVLDLALLCALAWTSGGAFSEVRYAFFAMPIAASLALRPRLTLAWAGAAVAGYVAVSLPHPATQGTDAYELLLSHALYLAWAGLAATMVSAALARRNERIEELADERGRLVEQAMSAEDRERRRLAEALHDHAVQNLLTARQDLRDAGRGHAEALGRADAVVQATLEQLRGEIFDLHPYVLDHAGLEAALRAVAEHHGSRQPGHPVISVAVRGQASGPRDGLVMAIARELLANACNHAQASTISVAVTAGDNGGDVVVEVSDDGRGFAPQEREAALRGGHIGLATVAERVRALDGSLAVDSAPGRGTRVRATLPTAAPQARREEWRTPGQPPRLRSSQG